MIEDLTPDASNMAEFQPVGFGRFFMGPEIEPLVVWFWFWDLTEKCHLILTSQFGATSGKTPVLKKGFLNGKGPKLYGPDGSKEGVVPENAGDPLGYIPKKLRNQCKIVDTRSPEYQEWF